MGYRFLEKIGAGGEVEGGLFVALVREGQGGNPNRSKGDDRPPSYRYSSAGAQINPVINTFTRLTI